MNQQNQQLFKELEQFKQQLETLTGIQKAQREVAQRYNLTEKKLEAQVVLGIEPLQKQFTADLKQLTDDYKTHLSLQLANPLASLTPIVEKINYILSLVEQTGTESTKKLNDAITQQSQRAQETQTLLQGQARSLNNEGRSNSEEIKATLTSVDQFLNSVSFERDVLQKIIEEVVSQTTNSITENLKQINATSNLFRERFQKLTDQLFERMQQLIADPNELSNHIVNHLKNHLDEFQDQTYERVLASQKSIEKVVVQLAERNIQQQETIQQLIEEQRQFLAQIKQIAVSPTAQLTPPAGGSVDGQG